MITMKPAHAKNFFFDRVLVTQYMDRKTASALAKGGGLIRRIAQNSMRSRKRASAPGTPPSRHKPRGQGFTYILYIFDPRTKSVVVGPVLFPNTVNEDGTTAPEANEFGGRVRRRAKRAQGHVFSIGERGPIREISQPSPRSKRFARPVLVSAKQVQRAQRIHDEYVLFRIAASDWSDEGFAMARFTLIEESIADMVGMVEDPLGIFVDQIGYGNSGLATRTCSGRHFAIQAACDQDDVTPGAALGSCFYSGPTGDPACSITTEADCALIPGTWTLGGTCS